MASETSGRRDPIKAVADWINRVWRFTLTRQIFLLGGAGCGFGALLGVAYVAGTQRAQTRMLEHLVEQQEMSRVTVQAENHPASSLSGKRLEDVKTIPPGEPIPEVWTRVAGLNVWIAGQREELGENGSSIIVMLHGYGRHRETLLGLSERLAARFNAVFMFPEAPIALDWSRRAWWLARPEKTNGRLTEGRLRARKQVIALLDELEERFDVAPDEIILAGFSQGGTLAIDTALYYKHRLKGVAVLSAQLKSPGDWETRMDRLDGLPMLVAHGRRDAVVPFAAAAKLKTKLEDAGADVMWVPHEQGHFLSRPAQKGLTHFIARVTGAPKAEPPVSQSGPTNSLVRPQNTGGSILRGPRSASRAKKLGDPR